MKEIIAKIEEKIANKTINLSELSQYLENDDNDLMISITEIVKDSSIIDNYLNSFLINIELTEETIRKNFSLEEADILIVYAIIKGKIVETEIIDYKEDTKISSSISMYLQEIRNLKKLDNDEIINHIKEYQNNLKLYNETKEEKYYIRAINHRDLCIKSNLRLVVFFAKRYSHTAVPFQDLIEEGNLGLINAIEKFDVSFETKFSTYASFLINQKMTKYLSEQGKLIKIPIRSQLEYSKYKKVCDDYQKKYGYAPSDEELHDILGFDLKTIKKLQEQTLKIISLDKKNDDDESRGLDYYNIVESGEFEEDVINKETVKELLKGLNEKEQLIIAYRYGLIDGYCWTLMEIGEKYGITRERVRQIEDKIIKKLRRSYLCSQSLINITEYFKKNKTYINKAIKQLDDSDKLILEKIVGKDLNKSININFFKEEPLLHIIKQIENNLDSIVVEQSFIEEYKNKRLIDIITREKFNELIKLNHNSIKYINLTKVYGLNLLNPANFNDTTINIELLKRTIDIINNQKSKYEDKTLQEITGISTVDLYFYINEFGADSKNFEIILNTFGKKLDKRYFIKDVSVENALNELINSKIPFAKSLRNKTLQEVLNMSDEDYYYFVENRKNSEYKSKALTKFFGNNLDKIYSNEYLFASDFKSLHISLTKLRKKQKDLSIAKNKVKNAFFNKTLQEYLELNDEEYQHILSLIDNKTVFYNNLKILFGSSLNLVYQKPSSLTKSIVKTELTLKFISDSLHRDSLYYHKTYKSLIKVNDMTIFDEEELYILKKAFGNNLNLRYFNTLTKKEEEMLTKIINKCCVYQDNDINLKELCNKIPIVYRLPIELYLGIYDGKKYSINEIESILNINEEEIKSRIKSAILLLKNYLNESELQLLKCL